MAGLGGIENAVKSSALHAIGAAAVNSLNKGRAALVVGWVVALAGKKARNIS
jgi:hypothetical protein